MKQLLAAMLVFVAGAASAGIETSKETLNDNRIEYSCTINILDEIKEGHFQYWINKIDSNDWGSFDYHKHNKEMDDWSLTKWCYIQALESLHDKTFTWKAGIQPATKSVTMDFIMRYNSYHGANSNINHPSSLNFTPIYLGPPTLGYNNPYAGCITDVEEYLELANYNYAKRYIHRFLTAIEPGYELTEENFRSAVQDTVRSLDWPNSCISEHSMSESTTITFTLTPKSEDNSNETTTSTDTTTDTTTTTESN